MNNDENAECRMQKAERICVVRNLSKDGSHHFLNYRKVVGVVIPVVDYVCWHLYILTYVHVS